MDTAREDTIRDVFALTRAINSGDTEGVRVILDNCDTTEVVTWLARFHAATIVIHARKQGITASQHTDWALSKCLGLAGR